jgi:hypothetical protein
MPFDGHRSCGEVEGGQSQNRPPAVLAHFQPAKRQILIIVAGGNPAGVALDLAEARSIHAAIGQALKLADSTEWPLRAVGGEK